MKQKIVVIRAGTDHATVMAASDPDAVVKQAVTETLSKYHGEISKNADGEVDLVAEMQKHPDALWIRVRAIEADIPNDNGDFFSREEIRKSYKSFEGVPIFTNHENQKVENAKGKIVYAEWNEEEGAVYCTGFIDRPAHPALCRAIEEGYATDVSMGTQVDFSTCSICDNKAFTADSYCTHVKTMKGRNINGKKVFERNYGLKFIELSVVTDGACRNCTVQEVLDPEEFLGQKTELLRAAESASDMVKRNIASGELHSEAGQQELQKLNQAMDLIEQVSRTMLDQRRYIDLEFLSKVIDVLADLQHVNDELVDQGYGSVGPGGAAQAQPGVPPPPAENMQIGKEQLGEEPKASVMGPATSGIGKITEPATAASSAGLAVTMSKVKDLREKLAKIYEEQKLSGGDPVDKSDKHEQTISKLAQVWENPSVRKFETEVRSGDYRLVVGDEEIIGVRDGVKLASLKRSELSPDLQSFIKEDFTQAAKILISSLQDKFAGVVVKAEKAPTSTKEQQQQTMELQLESQRPPLHPRTDEVRQSTTEDQLKGKKEGYDFHARADEKREAITEKQLAEGRKGYEHERQDKVRDETQELQLRNTGWEGNTNPADGPKQSAGVKDQAQQITEGQLNEWKGGKDQDPRESITEKQLKDQGDPWGRRIASKEDAKKAYAAGMKAIVRTAVATGATPDEIIVAVKAMTSSPQAALAAIKKVDEISAAKSGELRDTMLHRASYHGSAVKVATKADVSEYLLGSVSDVGMCGEVGIEVLERLAAQGDAKKRIAKAVEAGLEQEAAKAETSPKDYLNEVLAEEGSGETVKIILNASDIKADQKDKEAFAKAAYESATKVASLSGVKIVENVHVAAKDNGMVEVTMLGVVEAAAPGAYSVKCDKCGKEWQGHEGQKCHECGGKSVKAAAQQPAKTASAELEQRKEARKKLVEAQMPAGGAPMGGADPMGGGMPGGGGAPGAGGGTTMPAPGAGMPGAPADVSAIGTPPEGEGEEEGTGEALPPGSICPACGSDDVNVKKGDFNCNNCGASGTIFIKLEMDNWPGSLEEKGPEKGEGETGGEMGGEGGMEMPPPPGMAAAFRITPGMVKVAAGKPIGSTCPRCGSAKVAFKAKAGHGDGKCSTCSAEYRVDSFIDKENPADLWARVQWSDNLPKKAGKQECALEAKKAALESALKQKGLVAKFAKADRNGKAEIIANLHDEGLLK